MKLRTRILVVMLPVALIPLVATSVFFHLRYRNDQETAVGSHLHSVAAIQQSRLTAILRQNEERLALIASRTQLRLSLDRHLEQGDDASRDRMTRILADAARSIPDIVGISVYSPAGVVVASTDGPRIGQPHADPAVFSAGLEGRVVDDLFRDAEGAIRVRLMGPMVLEGRTIGVMVIRASVENLLASLSDYSGLGQTGEAILVRRLASGENLLLAPTRFDPDAAMTTCPNPAGRGHEAAPSREGLHIWQNDYRGHRVLAAPLAVPGTDWTVVVKMDRDEALAGVRTTARLALGLELFAVVVVIGAAMRFSSRLTAPLVQLSGAAEAIAGGEYGRTVRVDSTDELGALETSFNTMSSAVSRAERDLQRNITELNAEIAERKRIEEEREALIEELRRAMSEVRTLRGIIPICAQCKKIRDDHGSWSQVETYVRNHSDAQFSHGLCPDCLASAERELDRDLPPYPTGPDGT